MISEGSLSGVSREDVELARFSRVKDPDRVEDMISLPFPEK